LSALEAWCDEYLAPSPLDGETLRFDLSAYRSRVTREMLQARLRKTPQAFGASERSLDANITPDGTALEVDAAALMAANAVVKDRLAAGPAGAVDALQRLERAATTIDAAAADVATPMSVGRRPSPDALLAYVDASAQDQALGALKFCLPDLKPELAPWVTEDAALLPALLAPEAPSPWAWLKVQELALAAARVRGPGSVYRARLRRFRREAAYLYGEDVDFRAAESEEAIDGRAAVLGAEGLPAISSQRRRLRESRRADRSRKLRARRVFAERLAAGAADDHAARLVSHVLLARALTAHEDQNRRRKMRLLRDLRDLAALAGLRIEVAGLREFFDACAAGAQVDHHALQPAT
jgi:hypothetical protein